MRRAIKEYIRACDACQRRREKACRHKPLSRNAQPCVTFRHYECGGEYLSSENRNAKMGKAKRSPKAAYEAISIANDIRPRRTNKRRQERRMELSRKTLKAREGSCENETGISGENYDTTKNRDRTQIAHIGRLMIVHKSHSTRFEPLEAALEHGPTRRSRDYATRSDSPSPLLFRN
jgi:hypothetical protein